MWKRSSSPLSAGLPGGLAEPDGGAEATPETSGDDSRRTTVRPGAAGRRIAVRIRDAGPSGWVALVLGVAAAVLLFATELSTLSYRTIGQGACSTRVEPEVCSTSGGDAHSYVLWLVALAVLVFAFGAGVGRSRPAAIALAACGAVVLVIALALDMPDLDDKRELDTLYTNVQAHTGAAFRFEVIGRRLAVAAGLAGLTRVGLPRRAPREEEGLTASERAEERKRRRESAP